MSLPVSILDDSFAGGCMHPSRVWREYWLLVARLTFSIMSTSPLSGQFAPSIQNAGHTEHCKRVFKRCKRIGRKEKRSDTEGNVDCVHDDEGSERDIILAI